MKRLLTLTLLTLTLTTMISTDSAIAGPNGPCSGTRYWVHAGLSSSVRTERVKNLIRCATNLWPVAGGYPKALDVAMCESRLYPWAYGNGNGGVFQQRIRYWVGRADAYLRPAWFPRWSGVRDHGWFHARANVILSVRMARAVSWSHWSCA